LNYNTGALQYATLYYWRIDAANAAGSTAGSVWNFTTEHAPIGSVVVSGATQITSGVESSCYTATAYDILNNPVSDTYTWSLVTGTGTATISGSQLTGILIGSVTISATSNTNGTQGALQVMIVNGPVAEVIISGQAVITSGLGSNAYSAASQDAAGNPVSDTYTWTLITGTGTATISGSQLTGILVGRSPSKRPPPPIQMYLKQNR